MSNTNSLIISLHTYLDRNGWTCDNKHSNHVNELWVEPTKKFSILLPSIKSISHPRAQKTLSEAIEDIASLYQLSVEELSNLITNIGANVDLISIRTAGKAIPHGKINLSHGAKALSAIDALVRSAAKKYIEVPKDKQKIENFYLNSVNLLVPEAGSFIHRFEVDLSGDIDDVAEEKNQQIKSENIKRSINVKLAKMLISLREIDIENLSAISLFEKGINASICQHFINIFSEEVEQVEYDFDWSKEQPDPGLKTNKIIFDRSHKNKVEKIQEVFSGTKNFVLKDAAAHIERYQTPEGKDPLLVLKIKVDGKDRMCSVKLSSEKMQELMKGISEDINQQVSISAVITRVIEKSKPQYHISQLDEISLEKGQNIPLFNT